MIVKNETDHFIGIPVITEVGKDHVYGEPVDLPPGYKEIPDEMWKLARKQVMDRINLGTIKEEFFKVDFAEAEKYSIVLESENGTEKSKRLVPAKLSDLDRKGNKVINVVKETFDLGTLNKWYEIELRQDVRVEIQRQIDGINNGTIKG